MPPKHSPPDDLTVIPGLGKVAAQWLADRFDVTSFANLAALTAEEIYQQAKADSKRYTQETIAGWPQEALKRTHQSLENSPPPDANEQQPSTPSPVHSNQVKHKAPTHLPSPEKDGWKHIAYFNIEVQSRPTGSQGMEYRTILQHHETDKSKNIDGIQADKIGPWIFNQIKPLILQSPTSLPAIQDNESLPAVPHPLKLAFTQVKITPRSPTSPSITFQPGTQLPYIRLQSTQPFDLGVTLELVEPIPANLTHPGIQYQLKAYSHQSPGPKTDLGGSQPAHLTSEKTDYSATLTGIQLPPGTYKLQLLIDIPGPHPIPAFLELPYIKII